MLSIRGRDGSLQGAGRSAWSAKEEDISWFAHLLEICLFVPVAGLAGTAGSGVIPYAIDQQVGREFAIQAICLAQFRLKSRDFGSSLVKLPLQIRLERGASFPRYGTVLAIQPLRPDIGKVFQDRRQMFPDVFLAFLGKPPAELLGIDPNDFSKF